MVMTAAHIQPIFFFVKRHLRFPLFLCMLSENISRDAAGHEKKGRTVKSTPPDFGTFYRRHVSCPHFILFVWKRFISKYNGTSNALITRP